MYVRTLYIQTNYEHNNVTYSLSTTDCCPVMDNHLIGLVSAGGPMHEFCCTVPTLDCTVLPGLAERIEFGKLILQRKLKKYR